MSQIYTLTDIDGNKLGNSPSNRYPPSRTELENQLFKANQNCKTVIDCGNQLFNKCSELQDQVKSFNRDKKTWALEREDIDQELKRNYNEIQKLHTQFLANTNIAKQLQNENTNLIFQITEKEFSLINFKTKFSKKTNEIIRLREKIKKLKGESKKNSEKKDDAKLRVSNSSEISSLESKIVKLECIKDELTEKINKLEHQKLPSEKTISGGNELQKGTSKISDISTDSNRTIFLHQFLRKNNGQSLDSFSHIKSPEQQDFTSQNDVSQEITEVNTFSNVENRSLLQSNDCVSPPEINVLPNLVQQKIPNTSSDKSNSQISVGGIESMSYGRESASFSNMASSSPLQIYIILGLILIVFIWIIIKRVWAVMKKSEKKQSFPPPTHLQYTWISRVQCRRHLKHSNLAKVYPIENELTRDHQMVFGYQ
ncbi:hypothetical protein Glove_158g87 [Diversispora epigaea]|uniref:Uncharacterized protein n=1 Tax=Diversispora epigaea TaxID=1348612 RepID=A0A397IVA8_9GLOM|nr:hypothetical protein Glove_158g87 [Diversispora epigaea]